MLVHYTWGKEEVVSKELFEGFIKGIIIKDSIQDISDCYSFFSIHSDKFNLSDIKVIVTSNIDRTNKITFTCNISDR